MEDWHSYKTHLAIKRETETHPFSKGLKASTFSSVSVESTEIEYLDLIHSLVVANNATRILETGTHKGVSTVALGYALKRNLERTPIDRLELTSIEIEPDYAGEARKRVDTCGLSDIVTVIRDDSIRYLENHSSNSTYDLVFFDSSRAIRPSEFRLLVKRKLIKDDSLLIFHDTCMSPIKLGPNDKEIQEAYLDELEKISNQCKYKLVLPFSRGLTILQY